MNRWVQLTTCWRPGANDVMVIKPGPAESAKKQEIGKDNELLMIPFVWDHYVIDVNLEEGYVLVDWPL